MEYNELEKAFSLIEKRVKSMKTQSKFSINDVKEAESSLKALRKILIDFAIVGEIMDIKVNKSLKGDSNGFWEVVFSKNEKMNSQRYYF